MWVCAKAMSGEDCQIRLCHHQMPHYKSEECQSSLVSCAPGCTCPYCVPMKGEYKGWVLRQKINRMSGPG